MVPDFGLKVELLELSIQRFLTYPAAGEEAAAIPGSTGRCEQSSWDFQAVPHCGIQFPAGLMR
jgi:hypothetical protein